MRSSLPWAAYALLAFLVMQHALRVSGILHSDYLWGQIVTMNDGTAYRPFIYRTLIPWLVQAVSFLTPAGLQQWIGAGIANVVNDRVFGWRPEYAFYLEHQEEIYPTLLALLLMYASLIAYALGLQSLGREYFPGQYKLAVFAACLGLITVIPFAEWRLKVYDFSVLALTSWCLYALLREQWRLFFALFFLACLNKESALLIAPAYLALHYPDRRQPAFLKRLLAMAGIWAAVKLALFIIFSRSPGSFALFGHFRLLNDRQHELSMPDLIGMLMALFLFIYRWDDKPARLKWPCVALTGCNVILYFLFSKDSEYRVFFDSFPLLALMVAHSFSAAMKSDRTH